MGSTLTQTGGVQWKLKELFSWLKHVIMFLLKKKKNSLNEKEETGEYCYMDAKQALWEGEVGIKILM